MESNHSLSLEDPGGLSRVKKTPAEKTHSNRSIRQQLDSSESESASDNSPGYSPGK